MAAMANEVHLQVAPEAEAVAVAGVKGSHIGEASHAV